MISSENSASFHHCRMTGRGGKPRRECFWAPRVTDRKISACVSLTDLMAIRYRQWKTHGFDDVTKAHESSRIGMHRSFQCMCPLHHGERKSVAEKKHASPAI